VLGLDHSKKAVFGTCKYCVIGGTRPIALGGTAEWGCRNACFTLVSGHQLVFAAGRNTTLQSCLCSDRKRKEFVLNTILFPRKFVSNLQHFGGRRFARFYSPNLLLAFI